MPLPPPVRRHLAALRLLLVLTAVLGLVYPLTLIVLAHALFPHQAGGSLIRDHGRTVGSSLLGQNYTDSAGRPLPQWFQPRPSAATAPNSHGSGYNPLFSGASNLGPSNPLLITTVNARRQTLAELDHVPPDRIPADAVTASGSGLDPHISPQYAYRQADRIARVRGLPAAAVRRLVTRHVQDRTLGVLGAPRVNVLELNLALTHLRPI